MLAVLAVSAVCAMLLALLLPAKLLAMRGELAPPDCWDKVHRGQLLAPESPLLPPAPAAVVAAGPCAA